jgi:opacity protein-like surface antigen
MNSSLTHYIAAITKGIDPDDMNVSDNVDGTNSISRYDPYNNPNIPWLSTLGWLGYFIMDRPDNSYYSILSDGETVSPRLQVNERGYIESYDFSLGGNLWEKLYLGLTVSMTNMFYHMDSYYDEQFGRNESITLDNYLETEGVGYQAKVGAIWRPVDFLRIGVAYHSPTWYYLTDYYQGSTTASLSAARAAALNLDITDYEWAKTPDDAWNRYHFNTPYSWIFSVAGIIGTQAVVSLDYELKNYANMNLMDNHGNASGSNQYIDEDYKAASTLRLGAEYRFTPQLSGRLGYAYAQNPYKQDFREGRREAMIVGTVPHYTIDGDANYFTAGIGYRFTPQFYIDATFVYRTQTDDLYYFPSVVENGDFIEKSGPAYAKNSTAKGLVTVGYKF